MVLHHVWECARAEIREKANSCYTGYPPLEHFESRGDRQYMIHTLPEKVTDLYTTYYARDYRFYIFNGTEEQYHQHTISEHAHILNLIEGMTLKVGVFLRRVKLKDRRSYIFYYSG